VTMRRWTIGIIVVLGLLGAFAQPFPRLPTHSSRTRHGPLGDGICAVATSWTTWRVRTLPLCCGSRAAARWKSLAFQADSLWVPQHPAQGARYTRYTFYDPVNGRATGSFGPFWGQPSTPIFLNAAVFIIDNNGNFVLPPEPWEALMLSGGQYECLLFSPSPVLGYPDVFWTIRGIPAYRTSFGAFTDGFYIYPVFADNFGNITILFLAWIVVVDPNTLQVQRVIADYGGVIFDQIPSAALSSVSSNQSGSLLLLGFHNGLVVAIDTTIFDYAWFTNIPTLSDSGNGPEVPSDSVDRPIAVTSNNQTAIVCASNSGRVYGVAMADGSRQWEYQAGGAIMGGPSIGRDPNNANEDTVYIVVRHSPTQSAIHAIRASNGEGKWVRVLPNVSRCTPTIDQNGVLYIGDERGFLYAIDPNNMVKWQTYLSAPIRIAPVMGEFSYRGNPTTIMFVAASNRFLYAIVDQSVLSTGISPGTGIGGLGTVPLPGGAR
jgi:outer membrane protein assembly factor BamB